jgi:hypothetical protein
LQKAVSAILAAQSVVQAHSGSSNGWCDPVATVGSSTTVSTSSSVAVKGDVKLQLLVVFLNSALRLRAVHMLLLGEGLHACAADNLHDLAQVTCLYCTPTDTI